MFVNPETSTVNVVPEGTVTEPKERVTVVPLNEIAAPASVTDGLVVALTSEAEPAVPAGTVIVTSLSVLADAVVNSHV